MPIESTSILEELKFEIWKAYDEGFRTAHEFYNCLPPLEIHKMFFKNACRTHNQNYWESTFKNLKKISEDIKGGCHE